MNQAPVPNTRMKGGGDVQSVLDARRNTSKYLFISLLGRYIAMQTVGSLRRN